MNLCGRFFVKSNYIKATKDDWILCDLRLLTDDTETFLCIKSVLYNLSLTNNNEDKESFRDFKCFPENFSFKQFTALCNLSEYKSCSMKTETVNSSAFFALKLVPSGVFGNKKLLIATKDENEITSWLAICKSCIGKKTKSSISNKDNMSTFGTLSKSESFISLKNNLQGSELDFEEGLMDNEVYEACSPDEKIPTIVEEIGDYLKLSLHQLKCYLRLTSERLEVLDFNTHKPVHWFPYLLIRRFGAANGVLRVDAGRRCSTGDGKFFFRCSPPNNQPVDSLVIQIRQLALEAKQRSKRNQVSHSTSTLNYLDQIDSKFNHTGTFDNKNIRFSFGSVNRESIENETLPKTRINDKQNDLLNNSVDMADSKLQINERLSKFDSVNLERNKDVYKAVPCKIVSNVCEESTLNLYDNLPRPPRRPSRLQNPINELSLPTSVLENDACFEHETNYVSSLKKSDENNNIVFSFCNTTSPLVESEISKCLPTLNSQTMCASEESNNKINKSEYQASDLNKKKSFFINSTIENNNLIKPSIASAIDCFNYFDKNVTSSDGLKVDFTTQNYLRSTVFSHEDNYLTEKNVNSQSILSQASSKRPSSPFGSDIYKSEIEISDNCNIINTQTNLPKNKPQIKIPPMTKSHPYLNFHKINQIKPNLNHSNFLNQIEENKTSDLITTQSINQKDSIIKTRSSTINFEVFNSLKQDISTYKQIPIFNSCINTRKLNDTAINRNMREDSRKYLTELDNVIKELCEANEAAVQATRQASKQRQILDWSTTKLASPNLIDGQLMSLNK